VTTSDGKRFVGGKGCEAAEKDHHVNPAFFSMEPLRR
jgi:hypothetical protein